MKCPNDENTLTPDHYEDVEIFVCTRCKGRFMAEENLQKIEKSLKEFIDHDIRHRKRQYEDRRSCPKCNVNMIPSKYDRFETVTLNKCEQCSGIWLDAGELEDIQIAYEKYAENMANNDKTID